MDALSLATSGLVAAGDRFTASAVRIAGGSGDLSAELIEQASAKAAFEASVAVVKTTAEMSERLVDIVA